MGLFSWSRQRAQARSATLTFPAPPSYPSLPAVSYADVRVTNSVTAMQSIAVHAAVDLLASLSSELPIDVFSGEGEDRREVRAPGYLLDPAGDGAGLEDWRYQVAVSWLLRGNLYGDILAKSTSGYPTQVALFHPDEVSGYVDDDGVVCWYVNGREIPAQRMLHRRVNAVPGQVLGLSPIGLHADQIGLSLTSTRFGLQWFQDGAHPSGMLMNSEDDLTGTDKIPKVKAAFMAAVYGSREPLVLGRGWTFKNIQVSPEESQFLATQGYGEAQCARMFGPGVAEILGYDTGGSLTYTNVESRMTHLLVCTLDKWLTRQERLLTSMLPRPQYVRINRAALLRTTTLDRYKAHESALRARWKRVNEVRADEDMQPVPWGEGEPGPIDKAPKDDDDDPQPDAKKDA